jgi:hypothetical protein
LQFQAECYRIVYLKKTPLEGKWIGTDDFEVEAMLLKGYAGLWIAPGFPYHNSENVIKAVK